MTLAESSEVNNINCSFLFSKISDARGPMLECFFVPLFIV